MYLQMELCDSTGTVPGRLWEASEALVEALRGARFVRVRGRTEMYQNRLQLVATGLRAIAAEEVDLDAFLPRTPKDVEELWQQVVQTAGTVKNRGGDIGFYYWYYGTLGMFQMGGDYWKKWNEAIKPTLVNNQCKGGPLDGTAADKDGSWDPIFDQDDTRSGRAYSTAVGALCLEVYYRYLPMYTK